MAKRNLENNFLRQNYRLSWNYIRESKNFIYSVLIVFFIFIFFAVFFPVPGFIEEKILRFIEELFKRTEGMGLWQLMGFIFSNNIKSSFLGMFSGIALGIYPMAVIIANGYVLGFVASKTVAGNGIFVLWRLFPHGIFEIPALIISMGLGLKLGTFFFRKKKFEALENYFFNSLRVFFFVILPLLIIAAIIETALIILF